MATLTKEDDIIMEKCYQNAMKRWKVWKNCNRIVGLFKYEMCKEHCEMIDKEVAKAFRKSERERIVKLIESMANPYPSDVFLKPTKKELKEIIDALDRIREKRGLKADGVFGWMAKDGWNVCRTELIVKIREG